MCDVADVLLGGDCKPNLSGTTSFAYAIAKDSLDTLAGTYADDATYFSEEATYAVDDLVIYDGDVYKCTIIHTEAAFAPASFELIPNGFTRINGTHVPAATKGFAKLDLNDEESLYKFETLGKKFNRSGKLSSQLFHPGNTEEAAEFAHKCTLAGGMIVLIPLPDGRVVQIGTPNAYAEIVGSYESGTRENPDSRWLFDIMAYARTVNFYEGTIPVIA